MKKVEFTIPGPPVGKGRPRFQKNGHTYTPDKTRMYERLVESIYEATTDYVAPEGMPLGIHILAYYPIPESHPKARRMRELHNVERPTKKPDIDNVLKIILDGLNGIAYDDDKQIIEATIIKKFSTDPRVEVVLEEVLP